jgi:hypothetical protein
VACGIVLISMGSIVNRCGADVRKMKILLGYNKRISKKEGSYNRRNGVHAEDAFAARRR